MQQGRRYRGEETFVKDWGTFLKVQKNYDFIKGFNELTPQQYTQQIRNKFIELTKDDKNQCFVFPNSLKPQYLQVMIDLVKSNEFKLLLDYDHESLYMDNPKQLVVYKKRASISSYLSKYRLTKVYQTLFSEALTAGKQYQALLVERNIKISLQNSQQQIGELTTKIEHFTKAKLEPKLKTWREYVIRMVKDFIKQQKKQQMMFLGVSSLIVAELKEICKQHQLYFSNRFEKVSVQDEYRDVSFTKVDRSEASIQFDDRSNQSDQEAPAQPTQHAVEAQQKIVTQVPKNIQNVAFHGYVENGASCVISILSFGKLNPIDYLRIRLVSPKDTDHQKNYEQKILVAQHQLEYNVILHCLHNGCSTFQITAVNSVGVCKKPYLFKVWMQSLPDTVNAQGVMKINTNNYSLHILGQNHEGVIPNWDPQSTNIIMTTDEKWVKFKFGCAQFSVASHGTICNRQGDVASWGKMYYYDAEGINQDNKSEEEDEDELGLGLGKLQSQHYRIEKPCSILQSSFIRKVSCGQGYCLMVDSIGRAWSFGINTFGQLGLEHLNQSADTSDPIIIRYFTHEEIFVTDVVASYYGASFAIDDKGKAYRWGTNQIQASPNPIKDSYNNIINFEYPDIVAAQSLPIPIGKKQIAQKIKSIHPGMQFILALTQQNKVYGWGKIKYFGVGVMEDAHFNTIENVCNPIPIHSNIKDLSVGFRHCLARKLDNTLIGWGENKFYSVQEKSKQFTQKSEIVRENYSWRFVCGPDFTVFEESNDTITVVGNGAIFKQKQYKLPCRPIKIQAGQGVIIVMSDPKDQPQGEQQINQTETQVPVKIETE